ncbi:MAG: hypothetical protein HN742_14265 [Lentisphaerae bacterium]|jgi:hypothetical protein|nr:hypothetical protein [Lentisphaerota bacterium]MBT4818261.1 hypothetical protein [Lentisphaerota bacterium]MBT5606633.1 hypothetical protein [Lentisphaerota bacterium]MBT7059524.1 hypothetical protein [Lentisphaerota bacterium]MBT7843039.1 hypothetical protein [Lentisphaerota bacterium]
MNRYWLLNGTLLALAVFASYGMLNHDARARWRLPAALRGPLDAKALPTAGQKAQRDIDALRPTYSSGIDTLWQRSLFCKERTEEIKETPENEEPPEPTPEEEGLELVGIGIIGTKAAAIILITPKAGARRTAPTPKRVTTRGRTTAKRTAAKAPPKQRSRHVYRQGDKVGETGWTVRDILFDFVEDKEEKSEEKEAGDAQGEGKTSALTMGKPAPDGDEEDGKAKTRPKKRRKTGIVILESGERTLELVLSSGDAASDSRRDRAAMVARQKPAAKAVAAKKSPTNTAPRVLKPPTNYGPSRPPPHPGQLLKGGTPGAPPSATSTSGTSLQGTAAQRRQELRDRLNRLRAQNASRYQKPGSAGTPPK